MTDETWNNLRKKIAEHQTFPSVYMFKFILSSDNHKIAQIEALFNSENVPEIYLRPSNRGRYVSITVKQFVESVEQIIKIYHLASAIPGVMIM